MRREDVKLGIRWPEYDLAVESGTIRAFVEATEELGYDHATISDFVLVPDAGRAGIVALKREEALTMTAAMAAVSTRLGFMPTVLTLPKRQTVLVAEMAATIDRLCCGRLRLGVGVGAHRAEFEALGEDFETRGARFEEQIAVLRTLWSGSDDSLDGTWHSLPPVDHFGPTPAPEIPIWVAAGDESPRRVLERIGRLADGVIPPWSPNQRARDHLDVIERAARAAGRDHRAIGIEPKIALRKGKHLRWRTGECKNDDELATEVAAWIELGATHLEFKTRRCGLSTLDEHVAAMSSFRDLVRA